MLDFTTGNRNLPAFLSAAAAEGLFVNLRIGPYICAEWNFGGIPSWMKFVPGMEFRTINAPWLNASQAFVRQVVRVVEPYLARHGGPIVMAQIENEYSNIEGSKKDGRAYVAEQAAFALSLQLDVPWIMCSQQDAPQAIINTCKSDAVHTRLSMRDRCASSADVCCRAALLCSVAIIAMVSWRDIRKETPVSSMPGQRTGSAGLSCGDSPCSIALSRTSTSQVSRLTQYTVNNSSCNTAAAMTHALISAGLLLSLAAVPVTRWYMKGGSLHNYYMLMGGTNFGRTSGGPGIKVSYTYDAAINEFGLPNPHKFQQGRTMHAWLHHYATAIVGADTIPPLISLGGYQEAADYGSLVFLANMLSDSNATVQWPAGSNTSYTLPAWSVSYLDAASGEVVFNTATGPFMNDEFSQSSKTAAPLSRRDLPVAAAPAAESLLCFADTFGIWDADRAISSQRPLEQVNVTRDSTDYLFYSTTVTLTEAQLQQGSARVDVQFPGDYLSVALQQQSGSSSLLSPVSVLDHGVGSSTALNISLSGSGWSSGAATLVFLSQTLGLQHIGPSMELWTRGFQADSSIAFNGQDVTGGGWLQQPGLAGEAMRVQDWPSSSHAWTAAADCRSSVSASSLVWYRTQLTLKLDSDPDGRYALDLAGMGKGVLWVNGQSPGRYWLKIASTDAGAGDCSPCDYRGSYGYGRCSTGCNEPSQRYWHVPRSFLLNGVNDITFLEENPPTSPDAPLMVKLMRVN